MSTIVTRAGKGTPLTHTELDANFTNLNSDKAGYILAKVVPSLKPLARARASRLTPNAVKSQ